MINTPRTICISMTDSKQNWSDDANEVLFEIVVMGNAVKVSAVHVATNTEVVVMGSPAMTEFTLKQNALRKLRAALARKFGSGT